MSALPAELQHAIVRETKQTRNRAAKARRAHVPGSTGRDRVTLFDAVSRADGTAVLFAVAASDSSKAYPVTRDEAGAWRCSCFRFAWVGRCPHVEAAEAVDREREQGT